MLATPNYGYIRHKLREAFETRYPDRNDRTVRIAGIFFGRPEGKIAKEEVIPHLNYFNLRSANHIDFFCAGYGENLPKKVYTDRRLVTNLEGKDWHFSDLLFTQLREDIVSRTKWRYSGGADLILTNAKYNRRDRSADLDFSTAIAINLDQAKADNLFLTTDMFFEKIFEFAENQTGNDPTWGLSDHLGLRIAGSALKSLLLLVIPESTRNEVNKALHVYARDINP